MTKRRKVRLAGVMHGSKKSWTADIIKRCCCETSVIFVKYERIGRLFVQEWISSNVRLHAHYALFHHQQRRVELNTVNTQQPTQGRISWSTPKKGLVIIECIGAPSKLGMYRGWISQYHVLVELGYNTSLVLMEHDYICFSKSHQRRERVGN